MPGPTTIGIGWRGIGREEGSVSNHFDWAILAVSHTSFQSRDVPPLDRTALDVRDNGAGLSATCADDAIPWLAPMCATCLSSQARIT